MACDGCDRARAEGALFCPWCGEELRADCPECESHRRAGDRYCAECGKRLGLATQPPDRAPRRRSFLETAALWLLPVTLIILVAELAYLVGGTFTVLDWASDGSMGILALVPNLVTVGTISGASLQVAWLLIEAAILASVAVLAWQAWRTMSSDGGGIEGTHLYKTSLVFGASVALSVILSLIESALGSGIEVPDGMELGNTAEALLAYADAAVWEEVIARVAYIGVPMAVAALICRRRGAWRMLLGGFGLSKLSVALIVISALVFGFAHMSGWGWEKVIPTFASGLLMGYAYVRIGLHASITIHFLIDYLAVVMYTGLMVPIALLALLVMVLGALCLVLLVLRLRGFDGRLREMPAWMPPDQESIFSRTDRD